MAAGKPASPGERLRVSVMIRCHDQAAWLADAIGSVLGQSRMPDEIVVLDDGSDDGSAELGHRLLVGTGVDHQIVTTHPARGAVATANRCVQISKGDLLVLLDADDRMSPTYIEDMESALTMTNADFAYAGELLFGAVHLEQPVRPFLPDALRCENFINISAMFRRHVFDRVGGFRSDLEGIGFEDWDFWLSAAELGMTGIPVGTCWLEYRRHLTPSRNSRSRMQTLRVHVELMRRHPTMRPWHVVRWAGRAAWRTIMGRSTRARRDSAFVSPS